MSTEYYYVDAAGGQAGPLSADGLATMIVVAKVNLYSKLVDLTVCYFYLFICCSIILIIWGLLFISCRH
jgi:hypothetical protein